jgi:hypothetical protein
VKDANWAKVLFDLLMLLFLVMIYSVSSTGPLFHEIAGLAVFLLFSIHLFYNRKWIIHAKRKFKYIVDILLFATFILAGISGIFISKELFKLGHVFIWRNVHIYSSILSLILLGIHLGLHGDMITATIKKHLPLPTPIARTISALTFCTILALALYGIKTPPTETNTPNTHKTKPITLLNLLQDALAINNTQKPPKDHGQEENKGELQEPRNKFDVSSLILIPSGYLSAILLCSIITHGVARSLRPHAAGKEHGS